LTSYTNQFRLAALQLKILFNPFTKQATLIELDSTEPSPSVSVPCLQPTKGQVDEMPYNGHNFKETLAIRMITK